ncbi:ATP-binding cassette domain-containing protein [Streptomyces sp. ODS28]|uniref:ABC transporter ATP-binding protein n=1 Tax=Streptomyces sp. ODS28 TaxID=3136688 RepID=UPI0031E7EA1F
MTAEDRCRERTPVLAAEVENLRVRVGGSALVDGVSLRVRAGAVTALVGPSGSGKTTTGLALLGEYPRGAETSGAVRVHGGGPVGYVPQQPSAALNPVRRVGALLGDIARRQVRAEQAADSLPLGGRRAEARARVLRALEAAQLPDGEAVLRRYPHQLSGGQQQRVVLAQALLLGARAVVADEPTTGQDALTKRRIVAELAALARRGIGVLLLTHDLDVVRELADETVVLRDGRVVERGPTAEVFAAPEQGELLGGPGRAEGAAVSCAAGGVDGGLEVRIASASYRTGAGDGATVLRGVELELPSGELTALVGRSGSGKTTLGRCLAGLHRAYEGEVRLDGVPLPASVRARDRGQLAAVQYVFQDARASFDEHRTVLAQTARTAERLRGLSGAEAAREAGEALRRVGLDGDLAARRPGALSGGELQRAALARAVLARPRVLVCDEITSGLDAVSRRAVLSLLAGMREEHPRMTVLLITHDLEAAAIAHRMAVLDGGEIVEVGPAERVLKRPRHPLTASLVSAAAWEKAPASG